jgi:hypothetical protein
MAYWLQRKQLVTDMKSLQDQFQLRSGNICQLLRIRKDLIPHYYLLTFSRSAGEPTSVEVAEMLMLGMEQAQQLAQEHTGDREAFSILYSGYSARREAGWHIHIVLLGNRWKKAWLYLVLSGKNLLQAFGLRKDDAPRITK